MVAPKTVDTAEEGLTVRPYEAGTDSDDFLWRMYDVSLRSLIHPIWKDAMRKGWGIHLRALAVALVSVLLARNTPFFWFVALAAGFVGPGLMWVWLWAQMVKASEKARNEDLGHIAPYFGDSSEAGWGLGSKFFVALDAQLPEDAPGGQLAGCVGVVRASASEAQLKYLCVNEASKRWDATADKLLATAVAHIKRRGFKIVTVSLPLAQVFHVGALQRAGFKVLQHQKLNAWYELVQLRLAL